VLDECDFEFGARTTCVCPRWPDRTTGRGAVAAAAAFVRSLAGVLVMEAAHAATVARLYASSGRSIQVEATAVLFA